MRDQPRGPVSGQITSVEKFRRVLRAACVATRCQVVSDLLLTTATPREHGGARLASRNYLSSMQVCAARALRGHARALKRGRGGVWYTKAGSGTSSEPLLPAARSACARREQCGLPRQRQRTGAGEQNARPAPVAKAAAARVFYQRRGCSIVRKFSLPTDHSRRAHPCARTSRRGRGRAGASRARRGRRA